MDNIRWIQRFQNFENAYLLLESAFDKIEFSDLEKEGVIQRFEYTFELSWKTLKDYLEFLGVVIEQVTPRNVIRQASQAKIIKNGQLWIDMLSLRNLLSHTYDRQIFDRAIKEISEIYVSVMKDLYLKLKDVKIERA